MWALSRTKNFYFHELQNYNCVWAKLHFVQYGHQIRGMLLCVCLNFISKILIKPSRPLHARMPRRGALWHTREANSSDSDRDSRGHWINYEHSSGALTLLEISRAWGIILKWDMLRLQLWTHCSVKNRDDALLRACWKWIDWVMQQFGFTVKY